jgi:hypothetical protein
MDVRGVMKRFLTATCVSLGTATKKPPPLCGLELEGDVTVMSLEACPGKELNEGEKKRVKAAR